MKAMLGLLQHVNDGINNNWSMR